MQKLNNYTSNSPFSPLWVMAISAEMWLNLLIQSLLDDIGVPDKQFFYRLCYVVRKK